MIYYKSGYKYQLERNYVHKLPFGFQHHILVPFIDANKNGELVIRKGYAWDGPSGPTFDTKDFMRGSLVHDAGYQLIRERYIDDDYRRQFDEELRRICLEDGMIRIRAWWVYQAVRLFGGPACHVPKKTETAP